MRTYFECLNIDAKSIVAEIQFLANKETCASPFGSVACNGMNYCTYCGQRNIGVCQHLPGWSLQITAPLERSSRQFILQHFTHCHHPRLFVLAGATTNGLGANYRHTPPQYNWTTNWQSLSRIVKFSIRCGRTRA